MGTNEGLSFGIVRKILFVAIILIFVLAMVSFASKSEYNYVTIKFADESATILIFICIFLPIHPSNS